MKDARSALLDAEQRSQYQTRDKAVELETLKPTSKSVQTTPEALYRQHISLQCPTCPLIYKIMLAVFIIVMIIILVIVNLDRFPDQREDPVLIRTKSYKDAQDFVDLRLSFNSFNPLNHGARGIVTASANGIYADKLPLFIKSPIYVLAENVAITYPGGFSTAKDLELHPITRKLMDYPFDDYHFTLFLYVYANSSDAADDYAVDVPFSAHLDLYMPGFRTSRSSITIEDTYINVSWTTKRSHTKIFFSMFIVMIGWAISLLIFALAIDSGIRNREVPAPMLGFVASAAFATPALRNAQPDIGSVGVLSDYLGFFWHVALISISLCMLLSYHITRWKKPS